MAAGLSYSLFVKTDGTLWAMGQNTFGQLADGTTTNRSVPVLVAANVQEVAAGVYNSAFVVVGDWRLTTALPQIAGFSPVAIAVATPVVITGTGFATVTAVQFNGVNAASFTVDSPTQITAVAPTGVSAGGAISVTTIYGTTTSPTTYTLAIAPTMTTQPVSQALIVGGTVTFTVSAAGTEPFTYQWKKNGADVTGATSATLIISSVQASDLGDYTVVVTNASGSVTSAAATLTVEFAPTITAVTPDQTVTEGAEVELRVTAAGIPAPTYQWKKSGFTLAGETGAVLRLNPVARTNAGTYTMEASNRLGSVTSSPSTLVVHFAPGIEVPPQGRTVLVGEAVTFTVSAVGLPVPTFQWRKDGVAISGATSASYAIASAQFADAGAYTVVLTNSVSAVTSPAATLAVDAAPVITTQPQSQTVLAGANVTFTAAATGSPAPTYQWRKNGVTLDGATNATLPLPAVVVGNAGDYTVVVTNRTASVTSNTVTLTVNVPPTITTQPVNKIAAVETGITFTVAATGTGPLTYQWKKEGAALADGTRISGSTTATLSLANLALADSGSYTAVVTNVAGDVISNAAVLTVVDARATHAVVGSGYFAGGTVTITQTLTYTGAGSGLGWQMLLPAGWSYVSGGGTEGDVKPSVGTTSLLEWAWTNVPTSPVTFTVTLSAPAGQTGAKTIASLAIFRVAAGPTNILVKPDPLTVSQVTNHSTDTDRNFRISLLELTRVIELYNARNGTSRTGCYRVQDGSDDGFAPEPTRPGTATVTLARYHSADSNRDGKISLLELTRVIQLYNTRSGTTRTGDYHVHPGSEDGFNPGPLTVHPGL